ncbi:hypothetical protein ACF3DV_19160 [Chlorogloeopsis fritschii PCC 9212]|uniref:Uncharacterized protein n=1 Tax=Chlorogloeopsis fritschii PCC 6912 TaxID=211165 RepID=A0A433NH40_CHLFR|nr:hypothetical protein [Chlorogloeopsis fritschii]RUR81707.1 hypothetical protein PCC6912_25760 [Chlorogloeopsis fritschii PCC 6912]
MLNLSSEQTLYLLLLTHCLVGSIAAVIAWRKGRPLGLWIFLGIFCGVAALLVALLMKTRVSVN